MRADELKNWLSGKIEIRPIGDCVSRCKRIESSTKGLGVDLDNEYKIDGGVSLTQTLDYSKEDQENGRTPPGKISFKEGADIYNGMASLKSAASTYFDFCRAYPPDLSRDF